jgi:large subunit ribosomal protein L11
MAKKKIVKKIKLQIAAGKATPAPPIGPALGSAGLKIMDFCQQFNKLTQDKAGLILPVVITVYADKTFDFIMKQPPMAQQILKKVGIEKGSGVPNRDKKGVLTEAQVLEIAAAKIVDMNARDISKAANSVRGTARSMGIDIVK